MILSQSSQVISQGRLQDSRSFCALPRDAHTFGFTLVVPTNGCTWSDMLLYSLCTNRRLITNQGSWCGLDGWYVGQPGHRGQQETAMPVLLRIRRAYLHIDLQLNPSFVLSPTAAGSLVRWFVKQPDPRLPGGIRAGRKSVPLQPLVVRGQVPPSRPLPGQPHCRVRGFTFLHRAPWARGVSQVKWFRREFNAIC